MDRVKHYFCFICNQRVDYLKKYGHKVVNLKYIKQESKRVEFLQFFNINIEKPMNLNESVCKRHITKLNEHFKCGYFYNEEITHDSNENVPNLNANDSSSTLENDSNTNQSSPQVSTCSNSIETNENIIHHHHHYHHHHYHHHQLKDSEDNYLCLSHDGKVKTKHYLVNDENKNDYNDDDDNDKCVSSSRQSDGGDEKDGESDEESDDESEDESEDESDDDVDYNEENLNVLNQESESLVLSIPRTASSHTRCFVCKAYSGNSTFKVISNEGIIDVYLKLKILIKFGSRCCNSHLTEGGFLKDDFLKNIEVFKEEMRFSKKDMETFFKSVRSNITKTNSIFARFGDLENLDSELCISITNLTKDEFIFLFKDIKSIKKSSKRTKEQAIAIYLYWLKTGLSQKMIAIFFGFKSRLSIQKICRQVREAISKDFRPSYLGKFEKKSSRPYDRKFFLECSIFSEIAS